DWRPCQAESLTHQVLKAFYRQVIPRHILVELGLREDARRRPGPADATAAQRAADFDATLGRSAVDQARNISGGEGVARACSVDKLDRKTPGPKRAARARQKRPFGSTGDDDRLRAGGPKVARLSERVALPR